MKQMWAQLKAWVFAQRKNANSYLAATGTKYHPSNSYFREEITPHHIIFIFTIFLFVGLVTHKLMRISADDYAPVSVDFIHLLFTTAIWTIVLIIFTSLIYKIKQESPLTTKSAIFFVMAAIGLSILAYSTYTNYTYAPRSHKAEEAALAAKMVLKLSESLPIKLNDDISQQSVLFKQQTMILVFDVKNIVSHGWNEDVLRPQLKAQACDYFSKLSKYNTLKSVQYIMHDQDKRFDIIYRSQDCAASP